MQLRPYQRESVDAIFQHFKEESGAPLIVLPTGGGKSLVMASFIAEAMANAPQINVIVLAHVKELLEQNYKEIKNLWPTAPCGIYSAGIGRRETFDAFTRIVFAGIQSVHNKASELGNVDIIIVDEAHRIPRNSATQYYKFISSLREINPDVVLVGLTATPYRLDSGLLTEGKGALFSRIAYDVNVADLVAEGYLAPLVSKRTNLRVDLSNVKKRGNEFVQSEMAAAMEAGQNNELAVKEIIQNSQGRRSWLVFCASVDHCHHIEAELLAYGVSCAVITGNTPKDERKRIIDDYKAAKFLCLINCDVLTTGFNAPSVDLIAFLRATESISLYVQMAGRGTRLAPGKQDCLVLDFAGNVERHGPIDSISIKTVKCGEGKRNGESPSKTCPKCETICHISTRSCVCGFNFPKNDQKDKAYSSASELPIMSNVPASIYVRDVILSHHIKLGKPTSMMVDYVLRGKNIKEWVCFEHSDYPRKKAVEWWERSGIGGDVPETVSEAIDRLRSAMWCPESIMVIHRDGYWRVVNYTMPVMAESESVT